MAGKEDSIEREYRVPDDQIDGGPIDKGPPLTQRVTDERLRECLDESEVGCECFNCLVSRDLLDARAELATLREQLAKVCEAGKVLFGEVIDICDDPDCDGPRCAACKAMKAAIAAARKVEGE